MNFLSFTHSLMIHFHSFTSFPHLWTSYFWLITLKKVLFLNYSSNELTVGTVIGLGWMMAVEVESCCEDGEERWKRCGVEWCVLFVSGRGIKGHSLDRVPRMEAIAEYLATGANDIVVLQEVWSDEDFHRLRKGCSAVLPYSHYFYRSEEIENPLHPLLQKIKSFLLDELMAPTVFWPCSPKNCWFFRSVYVV